MLARQRQSIDASDSSVILIRATTLLKGFDDDGLVSVGFVVLLTLVPEVLDECIEFDVHGADNSL